MWRNARTAGSSRTPVPLPRASGPRTGSPWTPRRPDSALVTSHAFEVCRPASRGDRPVDAIAPGLTDRPGWVRSAPRKPSSATPTPAARAQRGDLRRAGRDQPAPSQQRTDGPAPAQSPAVAATPPTAPCTRSRSPACGPASAPVATSPAHRRRQTRPRDPPHSQALHHPRALPGADRHDDPSQHIEASGLAASARRSWLAERPRSGRSPAEVQQPIGIFVEYLRSGRG